MDLLFHAPYVLRPVLGLLGLGLAMAVVEACRRRGRERARAAPAILLTVGLALIVGGGLELTRLAPNARAADAALRAGLGLAAGGTVAVCGAAFAGRGQAKLRRF